MCLKLEAQAGAGKAPVGSAAEVDIVLPDELRSEG